MSFNVILPNGTTINNIPDGTTKEQIKLKAISSGLAVESDFDSSKLTNKKEPILKNILTKEDEEDLVAQSFYSSKLGTNAPLAVIEGQYKYEYGDNATVSYVNSQNQKPITIIDRFKPQNQPTPSESWTLFSQNFRQNNPLGVSVKRGVLTASQIGIKPLEERLKTVEESGGDFNKALEKDPQAAFLIATGISKGTISSDITKTLNINEEKLQKLAKTQEDITEKILSVPEKKRKSIGGMISTVASEIPSMGIYAIPVVGVAAGYTYNLARYYDSGFQEYYAAEISKGTDPQRASEIASNRAAGYASLFSVIGTAVDKVTLGVGKGIKPKPENIGKLFKKDTQLKILLDAQKPAVGEMFTEMGESFYLQIGTRDQINWNEVIENGAYGYLGGKLAGGTFGQINVLQQNRIKNAFIREGIDNKTAGEIVQAKNNKEAVDIFTKFFDKQVETLGQELKESQAAEKNALLESSILTLGDVNIIRKQYSNEELVEKIKSDPVFGETKETINLAQDVFLNGSEKSLDVLNTKIAEQFQSQEDVSITPEPEVTPTEEVVTEQVAEPETVAEPTVEPESELMKVIPSSLSIDKSGAAKFLDSNGKEILVDRDVNLLAFNAVTQAQKLLNSEQRSANFLGKQLIDNNLSLENAEYNNFIKAIVVKDGKNDFNKIENLVKNFDEKIVFIPRKKINKDGTYKLSDALIVEESLLDTVSLLKNESYIINNIPNNASGTLEVVVSGETVGKTDGSVGYYARNQKELAKPTPLAEPAIAEDEKIAMLEKQKKEMLYKRENVKTVYQGRGFTKDEIYTSTQTPAAGEGQYYAFTKNEASNYGDKITKSEIDISNLYQLDGNSFDVLLKELKENNPNLLPDIVNNDDRTNLSLSFRYREQLDQSPEIAQKLKELIISKGYNGFIIRGIQNELINPKSFRNLFGSNQIVVYPEATPVVELTPVDAEVNAERVASASEILLPNEIEETQPKRGQPKKIGLSKKLNAQVRELDDQGIIPTEENYAKAAEQQLDISYEDIITKINNGESIDKIDVAALTMAVANISNEIDLLQDKIDAGINVKDNATLRDLKENEALSIREAAGKASAEVARTLQMFSTVIDRNRYSRDNLFKKAEKVRSEDITDAEFKKTKDDLRAIAKEIKKQETQADEINEMSSLEKILYEVENAVRIIKTKPTSKREKNSASRLIKRRQDKIFNLISEINGVLPISKRIKKIQIEDSSGYLAMIQSLQTEVSKIRKSKKLDKRISDLQEELSIIRQIKKLKIEIKKRKNVKQNTILLEKLNKKIKKPSKRKPETDPLIIEKQATVRRLKREANRQIELLNTPDGLVRARQYWDTFRSLKLTFDVGHLFRQGGFVISNPRLAFSKNGMTFFKESFRAFNEVNADRAMATIESDPDYQMLIDGGLRIVQEGDDFGQREEILQNNLIENKVFDGFARSQVTGTNLIRFYAAKSYLENMPDPSPEEVKAVCKTINIMTGYGNVKGLSKENYRMANVILTSARFTASRIQAPFQLLRPSVFKNKALRNRLIQDSLAFWGLRMGLMFAFVLSVDDEDKVYIGMDYKKWTFGRLVIRLDNGYSRVYDPWAGIQTTIDLGLRLFGRKSQGTFTELGNFLDKRKHPSAGAVKAIVLGKDWRGKEFSNDPLTSRVEGALRSITPISAEGLFDSVYEDLGVLDAVTSVATDVVGISSFLIKTKDLP
jgi:hypothetical protein